MLRFEEWLRRVLPWCPALTLLVVEILYVLCIHMHECTHNISQAGFGVFFYRVNSDVLGVEYIQLISYVVIYYDIYILHKYIIYIYVTMCVCFGMTWFRSIVVMSIFRIPMCVEIQMWTTARQRSTVGSLKVAWRTGCSVCANAVRVFPQRWAGLPQLGSEVLGWTYLIVSLLDDEHQFWMYFILCIALHSARLRVCTSYSLGWRSETHDRVSAL